MPFSSVEEAFLVFPENRLAYTAVTGALNSKAPGAGRSSSAVYLYGSSGAGKTNLVRHSLRLAEREDASCRIAHWTASEFAANFANASCERKIADFQESFRQWDVFVLEDIQALERRPESQVQWLGVFDDLVARGCQVIVTGRKPPGELEGFPPRLINRFHGAVVAHLNFPGLASREALLHHFAAARQIPASSEALHRLAEAFPVSPRELLGILLQLEHAARANRQQIDADFLRRFLEQEVRPPQTTLESIAKSVARHFNVPVTKLRSRARVQRFVLPRQCAMFLARELTGERLNQIGRFFGDRDHSTVVHSCHRLEGLLSDQPEIRQHLTQIRGDLGVDRRVEC